MSKQWTIHFTAQADKQFAKLDKEVQKRIQNFLNCKLSKLIDPRQLGSSLTGTLSHFWRYRVGDYRLICSLEDDQLNILVIQVGHRREIYH